MAPGVGGRRVGPGTSPLAWSRDPCPTPAAIARPRRKTAFLRQILGPEAGQAPPGAAAGNGAAAALRSAPAVLRPNNRPPPRTGTGGTGRFLLPPECPGGSGAQPQQCPGPVPGGERWDGPELPQRAAPVLSGSPKRSSKEQHERPRGRGSARTHGRQGAWAGDSGAGSPCGTEQEITAGARGRRTGSGSRVGAGQLPAPPTRDPSFPAGRSRPGEGGFV